MGRLALLYAVTGCSLSEKLERRDRDKPKRKDIPLKKQKRGKHDDLRAFSRLVDARQQLEGFVTRGEEESRGLEKGKKNS